MVYPPGVFIIPVFTSISTRFTMNGQLRSVSPQFTPILLNILFRMFSLFWWDHWSWALILLPVGYGFLWLFWQPLYHTVATICHYYHRQRPTITIIRSTYYCANVSIRSMVLLQQRCLRTRRTLAFSRQFVLHFLYYGVFIQFHDHFLDLTKTLVFLVSWIGFMGLTLSSANHVLMIVTCISSMQLPWRKCIQMILSKDVRKTKY